MTVVFLHTYGILLAEFHVQLKPMVDARSFLILLGVLAVIATLVLLASRSLRYRERKSTNSPKGLFIEVCKAHGLRRAERRWLAYAAKRLGYTNSIQLFVDPDGWTPVFQLAEAEQRGAWAKGLYARLFGG